MLKARNTAIDNMQSNCIHRGSSIFFKPDVDSSITINYVPQLTMFHNQLLTQ
jgi:hypothetical protein